MPHPVHVKLLTLTRRVVGRAARAVAAPAGFPYAEAVRNGFALSPTSTRERFEELLARLDSLPWCDWYDDQARPSPVDVEAWFRSGNYRWDGRGVVLVAYESGEQYNPLTVGSQAAVSLESAIATTGESRRLGLMAFLALAHYLETTKVRNRTCVTWPYYFPFRDITRAWNSCLSQAVLMDLWGKCHDLTGEDRYRQLAQDSFRALITPIEDGGLSTRDVRGRIWLEEYTETHELRHVLNGFASAALIVWNNRKRLGAMLSPEAWAGWLDTLREAIAEYTDGDQVRYSAAGGVTPVHYFPQMARQLELLHRIDGDERFLEFAARWRTIHRRSTGLRLWNPLRRAA